MYDYHTLLDRFFYGGRWIIRAQHARTGACVDIYVADEDAPAAACYPGGSVVPCRRHRDGTLWFARPADLVTEDEADELDRLLYLREARQIAGDGPTDDELLAIREKPMSHRQRRAALAAMRKAPA